MQKKVLRREISKVILIGVILAVLRWLPTRNYNKLFNNLILTVNKEALPMYLIDFVDIIKFSPKVSAKYRSSSIEFSALKDTFPSLKSGYSVLSNKVVANRKKCGLPL